MLLSWLFCVGPAAADALKEAFVPDGSFNGGYVIDDRFATSYLYNDFYARKAARLSNGDVVVAGLVPAAYQVDQANGLFNIGLVRYGASGDRLGWPAATGSYVSFYERYIQFPNNYSYYDRIADLLVVNGYIIVLADYLNSGTQRNPQFVVFTENGSFVGNYSAGSLVNERAIGMVSFVSGGVRKLFTVNQLYYTVTSADGSRPAQYLRLNRFNVAADGSVSYDAGFGSGGAANVSDPDCAVLASHCDISANAIALVGSGTALLGPFLVYAIGDTHCNPPNGTLCVVGPNPVQILRLSPTTGALLSRNTAVLHDADAGNASLDSRAVDIVATRAALVGGGFSDTTYAAASVSGFCVTPGNSTAEYRRGAAVIRIDGNGAYDSSFAGGGTLVFGGQVAASCPPGDVPTADAKALALGPYDRLAVAGTTSDKAVSPTHSDGFLAVIRVDRQGVADYAMHPALMYGGQPWGNYAGFDDVIAYDGGTFVAAGPITTGYNAWQFGTARFRSDRIFADDLGP